MAVRLDAAVSMSSVFRVGLAGGDVLSFFDTAVAVLWEGGVVVARVGEGLDADTAAAAPEGGMGVPAALSAVAAAPGGVTMVGGTG